MPRTPRRPVVPESGIIASPARGSKAAVAPFVVDDGEFLQLHFNLRFTQSRMNLRSPNALTLLYTRKMMAFLLLQPAPEHVAIVGLGGGSLTKFCYRRLLRARVTTIEIDRQVIGMAHTFRVPEPDARLRIVHADAADYFAGSDEPVDVVLVDGCDERGIAPAFRSRSFYESLRRLLRPRGIVAVNLVGTPTRKDAVEKLVARTFGNRILTLHVPFGGNRIAFGFAGPEWPPDWARVHARAAVLDRRLNLGFAGFALQLERNYRRRERHGRG